MRRRPRPRLFPWLAVLTVPPLLVATGCVTVHGERAIVPSLTRAEAPKVLREFTAGYTRAYRTLDPAEVDRVETGALAEIGKADLTAQRALTPKGNPGYPALVLDDARFTVPQMAGWPKFFLADTRSNRDGNRWLVVFARSGPKEPWKAAYLSLMPRERVPSFTLDKDGYALPVPEKPGAGSGLALDPSAVSGAYTAYLGSGTGEVFAPSGATTQLRADRAKFARTPSFWTEYLDTPDGAPGFPPFALRTKDGGALVFFTAHHREKRTMAKGLRPAVTDQRTKALLGGDLRTAVTYTRVSESAVTVPAKRAGGRVTFLNRIELLIAARGD
ncbi:hypothetical protein [Streptomyces orinoci]|uniref:DUF8094 domain-containing protein n=1 Tax=Streptomyces orinoci TaxID=67339 RepID=A0ABV3JVG7_STRON|nr:hypothetical protein [Streptomyces orinoci]